MHLSHIQVKTTKLQKNFASIIYQQYRLYRDISSWHNPKIERV